MSRDHAACVANYCDAVMSGDIITGRYVQLAVERHLDDLDHAHQRGLHFDADIAEKSLRFVEAVCTHQKAEWAGNPFLLSPNQQFILWNLTGWRRADGCRRFRRAYITAGRKWGKSLFASAIMKLLTLYDTPHEPGAEVYSIATAEDQARLVYDAFLSMVEFSPSKKIRNAAKIRTKRCSFPGEHYRESIVRPLGSESKNKDGLNPHLVIVDELHAWRDYYRPLWEKMTTGSGSRRQPLTVIITTAGDDKSRIWAEQDFLAANTLEAAADGTQQNDNLFAFIARLDEDDNWQDQSLWPKANPNMLTAFPNGVPQWAEGMGTPKLEYLSEQAENAKLNPADENGFKRYHSNVKVTSLERAIPPAQWARCSGDLSEWPDQAYGGFDLGRTDDWAAAAVIAKVDETTDGDPVWQLRAQSWCCVNGSVDLKTHPFREWVSTGLISVCSGDAVDFARVEEWIVDANESLNVQQWNYDDTFADQLAQNLLNSHGVTVHPFYQNAKSYNEPLRSLLRTVRQQRLRHGGDPVLAWQAGNLVIRRDARDQWMPDKSESINKIDAVVAAVMAFEAALYGEFQGNEPGVFVF